MMKNNPQEILAYFETLVNSLLGNAKSPFDYSRLLSQIYSEHITLLEEVKNENKLSLACKPGCFYCCYMKVDAKAHEVLYILEEIKRTYNEKQLDELQTRCKQHKKAIALKTVEEQMGANLCCPLLVECKCSIYKARPFACRNFHSLAIDKCIEGYEKPEDLDAGGEEDNYLSTVGRAVWCATSTTFLNNGYDDRTYDLGSALSEALTNPACARRWRSKKHAFSSSCIAKEIDALGDRRRAD